VSGCAKLYLHGTFAANIEQGGFVNDVAFQQGVDAGAYGTVVVSNAEGCHAVVWRQDELAEFLRSRPEMHRNLNHVLVATLVKGLLMQREVAQAQNKGWAASGDDAGETHASTKRRKTRLSMTFSELHLREEPVRETSPQAPG